MADVISLGKIAFDENISKILFKFDHFYEE